MADDSWISIIRVRSGWIEIERSSYARKRSYYPSPASWRRLWAAIKNRLNRDGLVIDDIEGEHVTLSLYPH